MEEIVIVLGATVVVQPDQTKVFEASANKIREAALQEEGCLIFEVSQDEENINRFNVHEEFIDQKSFSLHQNRVRNSTWGAVSKNVERHYQINTIE